jgi:acetylornithine deacetylase
VIAPSAEARMMIRLVTPVDETMRVLRDWLGERGTLTIESVVEPVLLGTVPGFASDVVAYATDIPELTNWGRPYLYGPGSISVAHTDEEQIELSELREAVGAYQGLARAALAPAALSSAETAY